MSPYLKSFIAYGSLSSLGFRAYCLQVDRLPKLMIRSNCKSSDPFCFANMEYRSSFQKTLYAYEISENQRSKNIDTWKLNKNNLFVQKRNFMKSVKDKPALFQKLHYHSFD